MDHRAVLEVGVLADPDPRTVAAQHGAEPDAAMGARRCLQEMIVQGTRRASFQFPASDRRASRDQRTLADEISKTVVQIATRYLHLRRFRADHDPVF
jgi:hypothetical protein